MGISTTFEMGIGGAKERLIKIMRRDQGTPSNFDTQ